MNRDQLTKSIVDTSLLLCCYTLGVLGQGSVYWEMGMIGVSEGNASVEVCAVYFDAVDGFTIEISTTNDSASK